MGRKSRGSVTENGELEENRKRPQRGWWLEAEAKGHMESKSGQRQNGKDQGQNVVDIERECWKGQIVLKRQYCFHCLLYPVIRSKDVSPLVLKTEHCVSKSLLLTPESPNRCCTGHEARGLQAPHLPSCLLLCRKAWTWERSCSPFATCPQRAGSPSR